MTFELDKNDLRPMESFPLKWRWTDARWNLLPEEDLSRIVPLTEAKAAEIRRYMDKWFAECSLDPDQFTVTEMDDQHNADPAVARTWLSERIQEMEEKVWVSFDNRNAVVTDAEIFCRYWNDFCYPGSDVIAWPISETWILYYFHEETLYFGGPRTAQGKKAKTVQ